jgi:hypothetical protein
MSFDGGCESDVGDGRATVFQLVGRKWSVSLIAAAFSNDTSDAF